jgi:hypothetical protein
MNDTKRSSRHAVPQQQLFDPITSIVFATRGSVLVQEIDRARDRSTGLALLSGDSTTEEIIQVYPQTIKGLGTTCCKRCIRKHSSAASKF